MFCYNGNADGYVVLGELVYYYLFILIIFFAFALLLSIHNDLELIMKALY